MKIAYIGHSGFFITADNAGVLIDPFIAGNPLAVANFDTSDVKDILVTHGHFDHLGDSVKIAIDTGATITAVFELASYCKNMGAKAVGANIGGEIKLQNASAKMYPAFHSSADNNGTYLGCPCSFVIKIGGKTIYHAGDNCLNQELKTIGEMHKIDIALLPIGGHFTMGVDDAIIAAKWLNAETIIPMHYDTFGLIKTDISEFESKVAKADKKCIVMKPGETINII
ncbi:MAG: metal-dependent hydrolase [Alphaproteobacteria bacterium]|nr:metal-dependent hydrolase [Alphaproteobacteria bacterium]